MKLLFIFTGGTIGSTLVGETIAADETKSYKIIDFYSRKYKIDFEYDVCEPYVELSENNTGDSIRILTECVRDNLDKGYDGIIVTHGTDTMQFSAAAVGYTAGVDSVPICFVSSNSPIESCDSNALCNLHGAIELIRRAEDRGVFVIYKNLRDRVVKVHRATRLIGSKSFSDDVSSIFSTVYGQFDLDFNFERNADYSERADEISTLDFSSLCEMSEDIMLLFPYTGMTYPTIDDNIKYIIVNTYHSGTINTKSERAKRFFAEAKAKNVTVFATGIKEGPQYESSNMFSELNIIPLKNMSPVAAYVKLWALSSSGKYSYKNMISSLSGDISPL